MRCASFFQRCTTGALLEVNFSVYFFGFGPAMNSDNETEKEPAASGSDLSVK